MVVPFANSPQKKAGRVAPKSTPVTGPLNDERKRPTSLRLRRATAGALASLSAPLAGSVGLGLVTGTDRDGFPQNIAASKAQATTAPPTRPYRRAGAAAAAASAATASAAANFAAKVPGAPVVGAVLHFGTNSNIALQSLPRKSSLASRKVGGGKTADPSIKRRVKFSANVHTFPSVTSAKKSTRIGELQLKKKVKKLKRNRSRREGGSGETASELLNSSGIATSSNQDIYKHGTIVDVESVKSAAAAPRVLRLNVVGKSSPATGKSALATALLRRAKRTAAEEKAAKESGSGESRRKGKAKTKTGIKTGSASTKTLPGSSSRLVENGAGLAGRKKPVSTITGIQRSRVGQAQNGRRGNGKV
ncbi:uncharacterized protein LOC108109689 [Drosophila eugracilis]|uniref:uncharacterized protein LOC108109689 n=1 Tax=Drosophila eugracilis TaxID=29029 RepID=UPI0007E61317|nr:uncharacterized protein LOC108109689 [Drosophila eugracilis]